MLVTTVPLAVPPSMNSKAPCETTTPVAEPPELSSIAPPLFNSMPTMRPFTTAAPPETCVFEAMPPTTTVCWAPVMATVFEVTPPEDTSGRRRC